MRFKDRIQAGQLLADKLKGYADKDVVVYAIPRGGVLTAVEGAWLSPIQSGIRPQG